MASRLLMPLRVVASIAGGLPLVASALLLASPTHGPENAFAYQALAAASTGLMLLMAAAWLLASPRRIRAVVSPWEQGEWVRWNLGDNVDKVARPRWKRMILRPRNLHAVTVYSEQRFWTAWKDHGYNRPSIFVASSEPQRYAWTTVRWTDPLDEQTADELLRALGQHTTGNRRRHGSRRKPGPGVLGRR
jgi:hypothetical protein